LVKKIEGILGVKLKFYWKKLFAFVVTIIVY
jgi:hypothetical protein